MKASGKMGESKYFTSIEQEEAAIRNSQYNKQSNTRGKRPTFIFKSGASYNGEWLGKLRDGYGV